MAEILVLVDHVDGAVKKVTLELLTLARSLGEPSAVFVGNGADAAIATLAENGAATVTLPTPLIFCCPVAPRLKSWRSWFADKAPAAVLIPSTAEGKEVAGRLAVKINSGVITDAVGIDADLTSTQSIFGGSVIVKSQVSGARRSSRFVRIARRWKPHLLPEPVLMSRWICPIRPRRPPLRTRWRVEGRSPRTDRSRDCGLWWSRCWWG